MSQDLDKQIAAAQEALNDLVQTKQALEAMETWTLDTPLRQVVEKLTLLRSLGVVPVCFIYRDGNVILIRHDAVKGDPIKGRELA